jgi:FAD/FMN-containing dehydrogenase
MSKPFPFPALYWLNPLHKISDISLKDYVAIFEKHRNERPGGKFADEDIQELMRLAEDLDTVDVAETKYLFELLKAHPDYFRDEAQRSQLETFARTHDAYRTSIRDEFAKDILGTVPITFFRTQAGADFLSKAQALSDAVKENEAYYASKAMYSPAITQSVNSIASELARLAQGFTLGDVDHSGGEAIPVFFRDIENILVRTTGRTDHEAKFENGKWTNWNREVEVFPARYEQPKSTAALQTLLQQTNGPVRMVAGGHAFNISTSMGGTKALPAGVLITLDSHELTPGTRWVRMNPSDAAAKYHVDMEQANRVIHASAGIRLRDFGQLMWAEGMALPVAGSTDAQSLGGLIATDLHSTGKRVGFLSPQLLEVTVVNAAGQLVTFTKNEAVPRHQSGRWSWTPAPGAAPELLTHLPVSGALGTLGIVVEIVIKLDAAYHMFKIERFVPRAWAEANLERLLDVGQTDPLLAYDHVSFYYAGGDADPLETVRMNAWKRTVDPLSPAVHETKTIREIFDAVGSGFLPDLLLRLAGKKINAPGQPPGPDDNAIIAELNKRKPLVLQANDAFARKLFFQHDEIEVGIPLHGDYDIARSAIQATLTLMQKQEFKTIIEVRFTPDLSEAMLGPGTNGPTCYIELATALGDYTKERIAEVYDQFDRLMRSNYNARPHLGKKSVVTYNDMEALYGGLWQDFQNLRQRMDPDQRFLPADNPFLNQIFKK